MTTTASPREEQLRLLADGLSASPDQLARAIASGMDPQAFALELSAGGRAEVLARQIANAPDAWRREPVPAAASSAHLSGSVR